MAEVACAGLSERAGVRVLIGGLGLGFTLRAALRELSDDAEVVVAELVPEVVAWNADPGYGISVEAMRDSRVRVVQDDVTNVLRANPAGFDAIMLDTDNGPDGMLMSENAALYARHGIAATVAALRQGGSVVYWSVGRDAKFERALRGAALEVVAHEVRAHETTGPLHVLYVARRKA